MTRLIPYYMDVHVLHYYPASCPNRDFANLPKSEMMGGRKRARISSQCMKNAMRQSFPDYFDVKDLGIRTKRLTALLADKIAKLSGSDDRKKNEELAKKAIGYTGLKMDNNGDLKALFFISDAQLTALAELAVKGETKAQAYKDALEQNPSIDVILFGRMSADNKNLNVTAAVEMDNAVSTHKVYIETDDYAGQDDMSLHGGAAMLDTNYFYSALMYKHMDLRLDDVIKAARNDAAEIAGKVAESFIEAVPTGKIHSYAQRCCPSLIYVAFRNKPLSFENAFDQPVEADENGGFVRPSIERLNDFVGENYDNLTPAPDKAFVCLGGSVPSNLGEKKTMQEMIESIEGTVREYIEKEKKS